MSSELSCEDIDLNIANGKADCRKNILCLFSGVQHISLELGHVCTYLYVNSAVKF